MVIDNDYKNSLSWVVNEVVKEYRAIGKYHDTLFYSVLITETIYKFDEVYERLKPAYEKRNNLHDKTYFYDVVSRYTLNRMKHYIRDKLNTHAIY